jgi:tRNA pseudouridine38-40 synthase
MLQAVIGTGITAIQSIRSYHHFCNKFGSNLFEKINLYSIRLSRTVVMSSTTSTLGGNHDEHKDTFTTLSNPKRPASEDRDQEQVISQGEHSSSLSVSPPANKRSKVNAKKSHTWRRDFDKKKDTNEQGGKDLPPHVGSFANPALRDEFGVVLEERGKGETDGNADFSNTSITKKKVALLLAFLGTRYGGFQVNPNQRTLQAEIELALYRSGMISESNFGFPHKYAWSTSARTDKGVHACAQVCSLKVEIPEADLNNMEAVRQRLEARLPSDIRVLDVQRTTRNFCAKTQRDRVRYQYMVPSFLLHPDWRKLFVDLGIDIKTFRENGKDPLSVDEVQKVQDALQSYRSTNESRQLLQSALTKYEGTHYFHNFTRGLAPGQATAQRFIESFRAHNPVVMDGMEWIPTQVLGQSFLLHQIRKMISMAIDVGRGAAPLEVMDQALSKEGVVNVHVAPAQGLFLEMSYFGGYNRRKEQSHNDLPNLDWTVAGPAKDRWAAFRDVVRGHIVQEEKDQANFVQYMYVQERIYDFRKMYGISREVGNTEGTNGIALFDESSTAEKDV